MRLRLVIAGLVATGAVGAFAAAGPASGSGPEQNGVITQLNNHLQSCPGDEMTDMGLFVDDLSCSAALNDVRSVEREGIPTIWCPAGWELIRNARLPDVNASGSGRPSLTVCALQTPTGVQAYTMDLESLVG